MDGRKDVRRNRQKIGGRKLRKIGKTYRWTVKEDRKEQTGRRWGGDGRKNERTGQEQGGI